MVQLRRSFLHSPAVCTAGLRRAKPAQGYTEITDQGLPAHSQPSVFICGSITCLAALPEGTQPHRTAVGSQKQKLPQLHAWLQRTRPSPAPQAGCHSSFTLSLAPFPPTSNARPVKSAASPPDSLPVTHAQKHSPNGWRPCLSPTSWCCQSPRGHISVTEPTAPYA